MQRATTAPVTPPLRIARVIGSRQAMWQWWCCAWLALSVLSGSGLSGCCGCGSGCGCGCGCSADGCAIEAEAAEQCYSVNEDGKEEFSTPAYDGDILQRRLVLRVADIDDQPVAGADITILGSAITTGFTDKRGIGVLTFDAAQADKLAILIHSDEPRANLTRSLQIPRCNPRQLKLVAEVIVPRPLGESHFSAIDGGVFQHGKVRVHIPPNSLVDASGQPFNGMARLIVTFWDPTDPEQADTDSPDCTGSEEDCGGVSQADSMPDLGTLELCTSNGSACIETASGQRVMNPMTGEDEAAAVDADGTLLASVGMPLLEAEDEDTGAALQYDPNAPEPITIELVDQGTALNEEGILDGQPYNNPVTGAPFAAGDTNPLYSLPAAQTESASARQLNDELVFPQDLWTLEDPGGWLATPDPESGQLNLMAEVWGLNLHYNDDIGASNSCIKGTISYECMDGEKTVRLSDAGVFFRGYSPSGEWHTGTMVNEDGSYCWKAVRNSKVRISAKAAYAYEDEAGVVHHNIARQIDKWVITGDKKTSCKENNSADCTVRNFVKRCSDFDCEVTCYLETTLCGTAECSCPGQSSSRMYPQCGSN